MLSIRIGHRTPVSFRGALAQGVPSPGQTDRIILADTTEGAT